MTIYRYNVIQKPSLFKVSGDVFVAKQKKQLFEEVTLLSTFFGMIPFILTIIKHHLVGG